MAVRGTTACIYPASCVEGCYPLRHDGICALPPQHFDDLTMVFVITRLRKSRSALSRHQDIFPTQRCGTHVQGVMAAYREFLYNNSSIKGIGNMVSCRPAARCPHE